MTSSRTTTALVLLTSLAAVGAQAHSHTETRQAHAHVHGSGALNVAIEGSQVHLELVSPGFDILGFESINTDSQKKQLATAIAKLQDASLWSFTNTASCRLVSANVSLSTDDDSAHAGHKHSNKKASDNKAKTDAHKDHDHDHDHKDDKKKTTADSHDHKHDKKKADAHDHDHRHDHLDITASYVYQCAKISNLKTLQTKYFAQFANAEKLEVQGITSSSQFSGTITRAKPSLQF